LSDRRHSAVQGRDGTAPGRRERAGVYGDGLVVAGRGRARTLPHLWRPRVRPGTRATPGVLCGLYGPIGRTGRRDCYGRTGRIPGEADERDVGAGRTPRAHALPLTPRYDTRHVSKETSWTAPSRLSTWLPPWRKPRAAWRTRNSIRSTPISPAATVAW